MLKTCSVCSLEKQHYAKGMCRICYRKETEEWKKSKRKNPELYLLKQRERNKKWYEKAKLTEEYKEKEKIKHKVYYDSHKKEIIKKVGEWKRGQPREKKLLWGRRDAATREFASWDNIETIMNRYNRSCAICKMTNEEHHKIFNSRLSIHHINGLGRNMPRYLKDNRLENLIPLCKGCHQKVEKTNMDISEYVRT